VTYMSSSKVMKSWSLTWIYASKVAPTNNRQRSSCKPPVVRQNLLQVKWRRRGETVFRFLFSVFGMTKTVFCFLFSVSVGAGLKPAPTETENSKQ